VDKYEGSVWQIDQEEESGRELVAKVQAGEATLSDLLAGPGSNYQLGCADSNHVAFPSTFPGNGNWVSERYAVSVPGVLPTGCVSWFQAEQACRLAGKRLATNQEWQAAAAGTPDPGNTPGALDCNTTSGGPSITGSRTACVSKWGAFDMVGNVYERVADWSDTSNGCVTLPDYEGLGNDLSCVGGPGLGWSNFPGALYRGGYWDNGAAAGVFSVVATYPHLEINGIGFRCAR
jgi:formylglycine-generating enzyme required for sulfatase activity